MRSGETKTTQATSHGSLSISRRTAVGAGGGDALDVVDQVERAVAEGRPGAAVDRPAQAGAGLGGVRVDRLRRDHAAGDDDAAASGWADRSAGRSRAAPCGRRRRAAAATSARGSTATRPASAASGRAGARGCRTRRGRPGRRRSGTTATPPTSATAAPSGRRRGCRARRARPGWAGRRPAAAGRGSPSRRRPSRRRAHGSTMGGQDTGAGAGEAPARAVYDRGPMSVLPESALVAGRPAERRRRPARRPRRPPRHPASGVRRGHAAGTGARLPRRPSGLPGRRPGDVRRARRR